MIIFCSPESTHWFWKKVYWHGIKSDCIFRKNKHWYVIIYNISCHLHKEGLWLEGGGYIFVLLFNSAQESQRKKWVNSNIEKSKNWAVYYNKKILKTVGNSSGGGVNKWSYLHLFLHNGVIFHSVFIFMHPFYERRLSVIFFYIGRYKNY